MIKACLGNLANTLSRDRNADKLYCQRAHPEIISMGEVLKLNRIRLAKTGRVKPTRCSCGAATLLQCEFWSRVNVSIRKTHGKSFADLELNEYHRGNEPCEANHMLFSAIAECRGRSSLWTHRRCRAGSSFSCDAMSSTSIPFTLSESRPVRLRL